MRNQVTVTIFMPWLAGMQKEEYDSVYGTLFDIANDSSSLSHIEAKHLIAGMSAKNTSYSYETSPADVDFSAYANISRYVPGKQLSIQVGKTGSHVQTGPRDDVKYYNIVQSEFDDGHIIKQAMGHLEANEGASLENAVILTGQQTKPRLLSFQKVAMDEVTRQAPKVPVLNAQIIQQKETTVDFSL